jgi:hypothetical protein
MKAETTTVGEYARFLDDDAFWKDRIHDETLFDIQGGRIEDFDVDEFDPALPLTILDGVVINEDTHEVETTLVTFFSRWRKRQAGKEFLIWVPSDLTRKELDKHLAAIGAKVQSADQK